MLPKPYARPSLARFSAVFVDEGIEELPGQFPVASPQLPAGDALARVGGEARFDGALDRHRLVVVGVAQLDGAAGLDRLEGDDQLVDRQAEVLDLFYVEAGSRPDGGGREPRQRDQIGPRRERERDHFGATGAALVLPVTHLGSSHLQYPYPGGRGGNR